MNCRGRFQTCPDQFIGIHLVSLLEGEFEVVEHLRDGVESHAGVDGAVTGIDGDLRRDDATALEGLARGLQIADR